jgi:hypothetical protein
MNDVEDLLREGMDRFTRDLRAPAGLICRVTRRRRRRMFLRAVAGGAAALTAGAVAVATVVVPGLGAGGPVVETAYVVKRVDSALSAAEPGDIAQMRITTVSAGSPGGITTTTSEEWSYADQWRSVTYSPAGHPAYDEGSGTSSAYTLVSYLKRTWAQEPGPRLDVSPSGLRGCGPTGVALPLLFRFGLPALGTIASALPATVVRDLRTAISCGTLTEAGRQRVDGIEAIELTSRQGSPISETIWVSPGTDLPVRVVVLNIRGPSKPAISHSQAPVRQTADITWLRPTAQNLAELTVPIPAVFSRVAVLNVVAPILEGGPRVLCLGLDGAACEGAAFAVPGYRPFGSAPGPAGLP